MSHPTKQTSASWVPQGTCTCWACVPLNWGLIKSMGKVCQHLSVAAPECLCCSAPECGSRQDRQQPPKPFWQIGNSIQLSHSVVSDSLWLYGLSHARLPCPSPTPRAGSNSCPSGQWCHPTISSSVVPFFFCLQSFPELGSFLMSQFFASGGQSIEAPASASVLPMNIQD